MSPNKMKVTEWLAVKTHARQLYLPLPGDLVSVFSIQKGDYVKVEFHEIKRSGEPGNETFLRKGNISPEKGGEKP